MLNMPTIIRRQFATKTSHSWKTARAFCGKWVKYWETVAKDYKDVFLSVGQDIKQKPLKSSLYFTGAAFIGLCIKLNPDLQSFKAKYIEAANEMSLVPLSLANPTAVEHLKYIQQSFNHRHLRYVNLGIFSFIWVDKYSDQCHLFESNCSYLQISHRNITERLLDVGFLNVWWITSRKMLDYDINY